MRRFLSENGCHSFQRYLVSRPLPIDEFLRFVSAPATASLPGAN